MRRPAATDTIAAIATPAGHGGVGMLRLSGPAAATLARQIVGTLPAARRVALRRFLAADGAAIDRGLVLYFSAPHSYTGEEVVELYGHGGPVVMDLLLARCAELGARLARPGEFSERAFLNGKLDLAQAEAIADLIGAGSAAAARAALRSLDGAFSARVRALEAELASLRTHLEASIDFAEEELPALAGQELGARLATLGAALATLRGEAEQGRVLQQGLELVIAGRPNAGKSSLLNALAGTDAAIVAPLPGTTRDLVRERLSIDGLPFSVADTAGLRDDPDPVEAEGIRRARRAAAQADHILYVVDAADTAARAALTAELATLPPAVPVTVVYNKVDISGAEARAPMLPAATGWLAVSALTGAGLDALRAHLTKAAGWRGTEGGTFSARRRHLEALARAAARLAAAASQLETRAPLELVAEELRLAHDALGELTGRVSSDELLGRIFASFCIGK